MHLLLNNTVFIAATDLINDVINNVIPNTFGISLLFSKKMLDPPVITTVIREDFQTILPFPVVSEYFAKHFKIYNRFVLSLDRCSSYFEYNRQYII